MPGNGGAQRHPRSDEIGPPDDRPVPLEGAALASGHDALLYKMITDLAGDVRMIKQLIATVSTARDSEPPEPKEPAMSVTPEHMKEAISAAEARMDARIGRIESTMETIRSEVQGLRSEVIDTKNWVRNAFLATVALIIGTAATVYFGTKSDNQALIANLQAATSGARADGSIQGQILEQLKTLSERIDRQPTPPTSGPAK